MWYICLFEILRRLPAHGRRRRSKYGEALELLALEGQRHLVGPALLLGRVAVARPVRAELLDQSLIRNVRHAAGARREGSACNAGRLAEPADLAFAVARGATGVVRTLTCRIYDQETSV